MGTLCISMVQFTPKEQWDQSAASQSQTLGVKLPLNRRSSSSLRLGDTDDEFLFTSFVSVNSAPAHTRIGWPSPWRISDRSGCSLPCRNNEKVMQWIVFNIRPWRVDFAVRQFDFHMAIPDGQVKILENYQNLFTITSFFFYLCKLNLESLVLKVGFVIDQMKYQSPIICSSTYTRSSMRRVRLQQTLVATNRILCTKIIDINVKKVCSVKNYNEHLLTANNFLFIFLLIVRGVK